VGAVLLGEEGGKAYVARAAQYDERGDSKYYEAKCARALFVRRGERGAEGWAPGGVRLAFTK
jgi:hypothetical protein